MWQIRKIKQQRKQNKQQQQQKTPKEIHKDKNNNKKKRSEIKHNKTKKRDPLHFSEWFFTCSLPVSSSKTLEHNPFTLLSFFSKSSCFHWVV